MFYAETRTDPINSTEKFTFSICKIVKRGGRAPPENKT